MYTYSARCVYYIGHNGDLIVCVEFVRFRSNRTVDRLRFIITPITEPGLTSFLYSSIYPRVRFIRG